MSRKEGDYLKSIQLIAYSSLKFSCDILERHGAMNTYYHQPFKPVNLL